MPRPENPELVNEIVNQADALFRKRGYRAASYSKIAEAAGTTKGLMQYHFKKKDELACTVMARALDRAADALGYEQRPQTASLQSFEQLYRIGQVYFAYLLHENGYRLFLQDIVSDFALVDRVLAFNLSWALDYAYLSEKAADRAVVESVVMSMGGFYSLVHYDLVHDGCTDVRLHLRSVVHNVMCALGYEEREAARTLDAARLSDDELARTLTAMRSHER